VYYSAYIPVVQDPLLPSKTAGLLREHRLYQADWLLRFYGFSSEEILSENEDLPMEYDPKCAWALKNMQFFPVEINKASVEELLRVPGIGAKGAYKIVSARKYTTLTFEHLQKMRIVLKRAKHFITCAGKFFGSDDPQTVKLRLTLAERTDTAEQLSFFEHGLLPPPITQKFLLNSTPETALTVLTGQL